MSTEQQRAEILESADALVLRRNTSLRTLAEELAHRQQVPVREMIKEIERAYVDAAETQYGLFSFVFFAFAPRKALKFKKFPNLKPPLASKFCSFVLLSV